MHEHERHLDFRLSRPSASFGSTAGTLTWRFIPVAVAVTQIGKAQGRRVMSSNVLHRSLAVLRIQNRHAHRHHVDVRVMHDPERAGDHNDDK